MGRGRQDLDAALRDLRVELGGDGGGGAGAGAGGRDPRRGFGRGGGPLPPPDGGPPSAQQPQQQQPGMSPPQHRRKDEFGRDEREDGGAAGRDRGGGGGGGQCGRDGRRSPPGGFRKRSRDRMEGPRGNGGRSPLQRRRPDSRGGRWDQPPPGVLGGSPVQQGPPGGVHYERSPGCLRSLPPPQHVGAPGHPLHAHPPPPPPHQHPGAGGAALAPNAERLLQTLLASLPPEQAAALVATGGVAPGAAAAPQPGHGRRIWLNTQQAQTYPCYEGVLTLVKDVLMPYYRDGLIQKYVCAVFFFFVLG